MAQRWNTTFEKSYPRNVITDRFCMYIKNKFCDNPWLSMGELMPESITNENTEIITNGNKNDVYEYVDGSKVMITIKGKGIDPLLQQIMYRGLYDIKYYENDSNVSGTQCIQPECYSVDPDCIDNCILLCERFCEPPTISVTQHLGKISAPLVEWEDYQIQADDCNTHWFIRFIDQNLNTKSKIQIDYDGTVSAGFTKKRTECDSPKPFVMKLEARNGACGNNKTYEILLKDVIAKPMSMTMSTDNGTKTDYMVELVWYICMDWTF